MKIDCNENKQIERSNCTVYGYRLTKLYYLKLIDMEINRLKKVFAPLKLSEIQGTLNLDLQGSSHGSEVKC